MKSILLLSGIVFIYFTANAQNVGIGTDTPSAKLEVLQLEGNANTGILSTANPTNGTTFPDPVGVHGYSYDAAFIGWGIGVIGNGGFQGVHGEDMSLQSYTFGVYAAGDLGASGAKPFVIDYPLDPANKILRHYAIESNEVTNMYRGVAVLDQNGMATISLPEYFEAINKNVSYQLTSIGSAIQPYILEEVVNNTFVVKGAPDAKVSWVVYGERDDPTIQWYNSQGKNYNNEVSDKPAKLKGKYYNPEAYGQPANTGIHYREKEK